MIRGAGRLHRMDERAQHATPGEDAVRDGRHLFQNDGRDIDFPDNDALRAFQKVTALLTDLEDAVPRTTTPPLSLGAIRSPASLT